MYAKPSIAHYFQASKMASSRISVQNTGSNAQNEGPWVWNNLPRV